jgi:hypothetical protein
MAASLLALALLPGVLVADVAVALVGLAGGALSVTLMSEGQRRVPDAQYGKYLTLSSTVTTMAQPTLAAIAGAAAAVWGVPIILGAAAVPVVVTGAAIHTSSHPPAPMDDSIGS